MKIHNIESGSRGNATLVEYNNRLILIDMGVPLFKLTEALEKINKSLYDIDALLLTHSHWDHTKGVQYLPPLPIYCTEGTYDGLNINIIEPYEVFDINDLKILPVSTSHDAPNPVGFIIYHNDEKLVFITDTGFIPEKTLKYMSNGDYYVIESNYNLKMLYACNRPDSLKIRIASDTGHLSNEDSAIYMLDLIGDKTKCIMLAHISQESNTYDLAIETYKKKFKKAHKKLDGITLLALRQDEMTSFGD